jgi:zinc protease
MAVVAVGDADPARLEALIKRTFSAIPKRTRTAHDARGGAVARLDARHDRTDRELTASSVGVLWKLPPSRTRTVGDFRNTARRTALQRHAQRALQRDLAEARCRRSWGPAAAAGAFVRTVDVYSLDATAKEGTAAGVAGRAAHGGGARQRHGFPRQ